MPWWSKLLSVICKVTETVGGAHVILWVSVSVISLSLRLRLITLTSTLIITDITKTSSNNCLQIFLPVGDLINGVPLQWGVGIKYVTVKQYIYCLAPWPEKFHFPSWRVYWIDPPPSSPLKIVLCINVGLTYTSHLPLQFPSNFLWGGVDNIFAFGVLLSQQI